MHGIRRWLAVALLATAASAFAQEKDLPDPPRTGVYMTQLRALFAKWDTSADKYLDKDELAVAFRGEGARAYDYKKAKPTDKADEKDSLKDKDDSEKDKDKEKKPAEKKVDYSKYPDYVFLTALDKDGDEKVSRAEFMGWARDYAVQLRDQDEAVKAVTKLQQDLAKVKVTAKNKKSLEDKLKQQQKQLNALQAKMKKYQQVQKALGGS